MTNTATELALSDYYSETGGLAPANLIEAPPGSMVTSIRVLVTKGANLISVTSNGKRTTAIRQVERGRPSFEVQVVIPPGQTGELTFRLSEPTAAGNPRVPIQPLIDNVRPTVSVPAC